MAVMVGRISMPRSIVVIGGRARGDGSLLYKNGTRGANRVRGVVHKMRWRHPYGLSETNWPRHSSHRVK